MDRGMERLIDEWMNWFADAESHFQYPVFQTKSNDPSTSPPINSKKLQQDLEDAQRKHATVKKQLEEIESKHKLMMQEKINLEKDQSKLVTHNSKLTRELETLKKELSLQKETSTPGSEDAAQLRKIVEEKTRSNSDLMEQLASKEFENQELKDLKEKLEKEIDSYFMRCQELQGKLEAEGTSCDGPAQNTFVFAPVEDASMVAEREAGLKKEIEGLKRELSENSKRMNMERYDLQKVISEKNKIIEENKVTCDWLRGEVEKLKTQVKLVNCFVRIIQNILS